MTLPQVINILRDLTEEAERVEAREGVTWLNEARKAIVEEWDKEFDAEYDEYDRAQLSPINE